jgi:hypothetical protein
VIATEVDSFVPMYAEQYKIAPSYL